MYFLTIVRQIFEASTRVKGVLLPLQDPNARNCHGYRKFVKRTVLESPESGYLVNDTIIIRYTIELVVSSGGALQKQPSQPVKTNEIQVSA